MTRFWLSWIHTTQAGVLELHTPWWVSGYRDEEVCICAAVVADSEEAAKALIVAAYDVTPAELEWRFCVEREPDWSPFCSRFPKADWMRWPS